MEITSYDVKFGINRYLSIYPMEEERLLEFTTHRGLTIEIILTVNFEIKCLFSKDDYSKEYLFQPLKIEVDEAVMEKYGEKIEGAKVELILAWTIFIGGVESNVKLLSDSGEIKLKCYTNELYHINSGKDIVLVVERIFSDFKPFDGLLEKEKFFLLTIEDLDRRLASGDRFRHNYNIIKASGLLRSMLIDDVGYLNSMAKPYNIIPKFLIRTTSKEGEPKLGSIVMNAVTLSVDRHPYSPVITLRQEDFMNRIVQVISEDSFSVRDVIKAVANGKGGVHAKIRDSKVKETRVLEFDLEYLSGDNENSLQFIFQIGRVTLKALEPIVNAIIARSKNNRV